MLREILVAQIKNILNSFKVILEVAEQNQTCKRKAVGCRLVSFEDEMMIDSKVVYNGPSFNNVCSNEKGNCGCSHAEPRAIMQHLKGFARTEMVLNEKVWMVCTYSPCTNCANIIVDSGIVQGVFRDILTEHDVRGEKILLDAGIKVITKQQLEDLLHDLDLEIIASDDLETVHKEILMALENAQIKRQ